MAANTHAMLLVEALEVLRDVRGDRAVVTSMGTSREWPRLSQHPLDFHYIPSTMGGVVPLGLGLALARPNREFIALCGDGSLIMNLGSLLTVAASGAANLTVVLVNNGVYEVTGGQATAAGDARARGRNIDFTSVAGNCGVPCVRYFDDLDRWREGAAVTLEHFGPRFIELVVVPVVENSRLESPGPILPRIAAFRQAISPTPDP